MLRVNGMAYTLKERHIKSKKQDSANYQKVLWRWRQLRGEEASDHIRQLAGPLEGILLS